MHKTALTIAGSDPSGGAGFQADLKTFAAYSVYGMATPAALTVQNTQGVLDVRAVSPAFMEAQLMTLLSDVRVDAAKTGMLLTTKNIYIVAEAVRIHRVPNLVVDPVMVSTSGRRLLRKNALNALIKELFPLAELVMPNISEAAVLAKMEVATREDMKEAAMRIHGLGSRFVLVKGGHHRGEAIDVFFNGVEAFEFPGRRIKGKELHGTGCVLSAAVTAGLAKGMAMIEAVAAAKEFVTNAIKKAEPTGEGRIPII